MTTSDLPRHAEAETSIAPPDRKASEKTDSRTRTRRQPPYAVILHNDNVNSMEYVVSVLRKVFRYGLLRSSRIMLTAHLRGNAIIWSGALEVAELKRDQVRGCGPDPQMRDRGALPLRVSVEPLPQ